MPMITATQAAQVSGKSISTITRAISSGRMSATVLSNGKSVIDPAELERVFPSNAPQRSMAGRTTDSLRDASVASDAIKLGGTPGQDDLRAQVLEARIEEILRLVRTLESDKDDLRKRLDRAEESRDIALRLLEDKREKLEPQQQNHPHTTTATLRENTPAKALVKGIKKTPQKATQKGKKKK
ncbi:MAG: hypothetical protein HQL93_04140 [Magnetococcales bacterium]|nr:hypothetical protein [Magnetococcales bacterium]